MSEFGLSIPSMGTLIFGAVVCAVGLIVLWREIVKPRLVPDRRRHKVKVELERRESERRKYPRHQHA